nr:hypothetical protein [Tanacetum cinerariifolium]
MWKLRIEQYFQVQDYALWDVIENGNSFNLVLRIRVNADGTSTSTISGPVTAEEKAQKKNDVKARSMLLMALPNEHLLTFSQYKDAKTLFEAIQAGFGGNDATKTQKTILKQMYKNFNAPSTESIDSIFNMLNKPDLETMSFDDLYNNFKIIEQEVKRTVVSSSSSGSPNMVFFSSPNSTNKVDTASIQVSASSTPVSTVSSPNNIANLSDATVYAFLANHPNGSQLVHEDLKQIHEDDLEEIDLKWQLALLSMRARRYFQRTGKKITINGSDTALYDKKKVECFNCHKMGHFARECKSPRSQESRPRNQDSSRKTMIMEDTSSKAMVAIDGAGFDWSYMGDDEVPTNIDLMAFSESEIPLIKKVSDAPIIEDWVSDCYEDESEEVSGIVPISTARQSSSRVVAPVSTVRPINTVALKPIVNVAKSRLNAFQKTHSLLRTPFHQQTTLKNRYLVNTAKVKSVNTVNTAKRKSVTSDIGKQGSNDVKSSACWVWRPKRFKIMSPKTMDHTFGDPQAALRDTRIFDCGCSRHMT